MSTLVQPGVDVRAAASRPRTRLPWLDSRHSFSFGGHWDPDNTSFGVLLVNNDDVVAPGSGFETHPHRDMEIVTWVVRGALVHQDSEGHSGLIYPRLAQRMSAGTGILHSEKNDARAVPGRETPDEPVHFVQMWVVPDGAGARPGYEQAEVDAELLSGGLVTVASGRPEDAGSTAVRIGQRHASLRVARLSPGAAVHLPDAPFVHLFVAEGGALLEGHGPLATGDAVRLTADGGRRVVGGPSGAEVLVWDMDAALA